MELMDKRPKVAVFLESAYLTNRELLTGFLKCTRLHGLWTPVLRTTDLSQDAIASECGLYDASHMNAVFRRRRGTLPSSYR